MDNAFFMYYTNNVNGIIMTSIKEIINLEVILYIHSPRVPSVEEIVCALKVMLTKINREKLWVNPDCGLKTRGVPETDASLRNMVEATKEIRKN